MSTNGRGPSRQRLPNAAFAAQAFDGDDVNFDNGAPGAGPMGLRQLPAGQAPIVEPNGLYGLAADLAGVGPSAPEGNPGVPLAGRPARLGAARASRRALPQSVPVRAPVRQPAAAATGPQAPTDPFALADAQRHPPPPLPPGEAPYGLALELLNNQGSAFLSAGPAADPRDRRRNRGQPVARLGAPDRVAAAPVSQIPTLDPFTVMEMAANQEGLPEPDYGIVAELRNRAPPDPFAQDFGLVAEVARRRSRSLSPLARGAGALPPLRARRRMDPVMPPDSEGGYSLADDIAARRRQDAADMAEPFGAAARAGQTDPFAAADEQLKVPRELIDPYEPSQQEVPGDPVLLKTPGDDASETSHVSRDDQQYGIADELGVDPATGRRQGFDEHGMPLPGQADGEQAEPPGHRYVYDEDTGMLTTTAGGQGEGGRKARQYIEDEVTGNFFKLHSKRRKLFGLLRRKEPTMTEEDEDDDQDKGFRGRLRRTLEVLTNIFNILGMFAQGLVAGFALLNFFMTYMLYASTNLKKFLMYYAALAQDNNRIYYSLLVFAVISSTSRLARDKLRGFEPRRLLLAPVDFGQLLLYLAAYVTSVLCTPLDDELTYEWDRNPRFYQLTFSKSFKRRMTVWHTLNIIRTICVGLAWVLTCYQTSPYVFDATLRAEIRAMRRQEAQLRSLNGPVHSVATDSRLPLKGA